MIYLCVFIDDKISSTTGTAAQCDQTLEVFKCDRTGAIAANSSFGLANRNDIAALDGNVAIFFAVRLADTNTRSSTCAALCGHITLLDVNITRAAVIAAADARTILTTGGGHFTVVDSDVSNSTVETCTDTSTTVASGGGHIAVVNSDVSNSTV
ncbi:MAG: hypothetical protein HFG11_10930, partial [Oscillibacter sp.]|nr:hypothetical protein [Oscillibacter sp.]